LRSRGGGVFAPAKIVFKALGLAWTPRLAKEIDIVRQHPSQIRRLRGDGLFENCDLLLT